MNYPGKDDWYRRMAALRAEARSLTVAALGRQPSPKRNDNLNRRLAKLADEQLRRLVAPLEQAPPEEREQMMPRCKAGCSHCCYQWVRVSIPEVLAIGEYIYENFSEDEIEGFRAAAREYRRQWENVPAGTRPTIRCPLLVDDKCSVYPVRPLIARGTASLDADKCIERREHPERVVMTPVVRPMLDIAWQLKAGLQEGLAENGLPDYDVVLGLAVGAVLENPDAAESYLAGEDPFLEARAPND